MSKISLIENSYTFINEAILNSRKGKRDIKYLSFSILHLIQGLELMLKHVLKNEHPILIYENVDNPNNTVSLSQCLMRLKSIANVDIDEKEDKIIKRAIAQRNKIVHFEYEINKHHQRSIFVQLFEFIHYFHKKHIGDELHNHISEKLWHTEAELLAEFKNEWVEYKGRKRPNDFPLETITSQKYIAFRQIKNGVTKYFHREVHKIYQNLNGSCPDCGVEIGEFHLSFCDIEKCTICGEQLLGCLVSAKKCKPEYWILKKGQKLEHV
jgi:RNA polymerase-binding transcription factor DksA